MKLVSVDGLKALAEKLRKARPAFDKEIIVSTDATCCLLRGSRQVAEAFSAELEKQGLTGTAGLRLTGCLGFCEMEPMVVINPAGIMYRHVTPEDAPEIVAASVKGDDVVERLLYKDPATKKKIAVKNDIPFYGKQLRIVSGPNEGISPVSIDDYIAAGGYQALAGVLAGGDPEGVIKTVSDAGLRGRGGGGFPTGKKWATCRKSPSEDGVRYVICNADEGDPGAYMDRSILESNPHSLLEGMIIGSFAIGSAQGYIYVRAEYPLAVDHLKKAIAQAEEYGLVGKNILGSGHDFTIAINKGAGAFVCGESTALMASLEGKVGRPRAKYVHTVARGLNNRPSTLNNVETWATVPLILEKGAEWFSAIGTEKSKGTKIFSLVGKINNTGLVEVPMGITLREIIYDIGGGIPKDKKFKAVQTGGPSGGCIPESMLDLEVDFDKLSSVGSMMGSGGMIVMDEDTCMVDVARYFLDFLKNESCGKCVPCREGIKQCLGILERICSGGGTMDDLDTLTEMGSYLEDTALCALGSSAANPVLTTLKYFREEYEQHINDKFCAAGVCKDLFRFEIDTDACTGCTLCSKKCPVNTISGEKKAAHVINQDNCVKCGVCYDACNFDAIKKVRTDAVSA